jgi:hypothetical protein
MFINTVAVGRVNAPLYRTGSVYLVIVYVRNMRGKFSEVERYTGTRSSVVASRNTAVTIHS